MEKLVVSLYQVFCTNEHFKIENLDSFRKSLHLFRSRSKSCYLRYASFISFALQTLRHATLFCVMSRLSLSEHIQSAQ